jgi:putative membrane protein
MYRTFAYAALAVAIPLLAASAQERREPVQRKDFKKAADLPLDREFLIAANVCCNAQMEYAKLADRRSARDDVKEFARMIQEDHKKGCDRIAEIVKDRKLAIVTGTEKETRERLDNLGKLRNATFDRAFLKRIEEDHEKAIKMCENQVSNGKDKEITAFARESLPKLKKHLEKAKSLQTKASK